MLKNLNVLLGYVRVSTDEQTDSLDAQQTTISKELGRLGYKGKIEFFVEQVSGTKLDREEFSKMLERAKELKEKGKKVGVVVRDIQRFARHPYFFGYFMTDLYVLNIPVIALNDQQHSGTFSEPNPAGEMLLTILATVGGQEVSIRKKQTLQGVAESRAKGIVSGSIVELYPKEPLNPFRELLRMIKAGVGRNKQAQRLGRSTSWVSKWTNKFEEWGLKGGEAKVEEYLNATDMLRAYEQKYGQGTGGTAKVQPKIVRRMTSGYLQEPFDYEVFTQEDIDEFHTNYKLYKPRKKK